MLQRQTIQLLSDSPRTGRVPLCGCHLGQFGKEAAS